MIILVVFMENKFQNKNLGNKYFGLIHCGAGEVLSCLTSLPRKVSIIFSTHNTRTLCMYVKICIYIYMDWRGGFNLWCQTGPKIRFSPQTGWNPRPKELCLRSQYWQWMTCYLGCTCAVLGDLAITGDIIAIASFEVLISLQASTP